MTLRDHRLLPLVLLACEGDRCGGEPLELGMDGGPGLALVERRTSSVGSMVWDLDSQSSSLTWLVEDNGVASCDVDILWHGYLATGYESNTRYCEDCTYEFHVNEEIVEDRGETWCYYDPVWTGISDGSWDPIHIGLVTDEAGLATELIGITRQTYGYYFSSYTWYEEVLMASTDGDAPAALVAEEGLLDWAGTWYASGVLPDAYHPCGDDLPYDGDYEVWPYDLSGSGYYGINSYTGRDELGCGGADSDQWVVDLDESSAMQVSVATTRDAALVPAFHVNRPNGCTYTDNEPPLSTASALSWQPLTSQLIVADASGRWTIYVVDTGEGCEGGSANYDIDVLILPD